MDPEAYNKSIGDTSGWYEVERTFSQASAQGMQRGASNSSSGSGSTSFSNYSNLSPITPIDEGTMVTADCYDTSSYYSSYVNNDSTSYTYCPSEHSPSTSVHVDDDYSNYTSSGYPTFRPEDYYGQGNSYVAPTDATGMMLIPTSDSTPRTSYASPVPFNAPASGPSNGTGFHVCLTPNCEKKFKRKADLDRHYEHKHTPVDLMQQYLCDYPKCSRRAEPFHRLDHFRDHYRDFHKEDMPRKKGEHKSWYNDRAYTPNWWRCSKCLKRRYVAKDGWDCLACSSRCDATRRQRREAMS